MNSDTKEIKIKVENKLSIKSAVNYSNAFVEKVSKAVYTDKQLVFGEDLPKLTEIRQINFLFIYILLQSWKSETKKLHSPYFNFQSEDVQKALEQFMNVLSRNIAIKKEDFEPLLKKAYQLALLYFNNPMNFLGEIFQQKVTLKELEELHKLVKSNFVQGIIAFLQEENLDEIVLEELEPSSLELEDSTKFLEILTAFLDLETSKKEDPVTEKFVNQFKINTTPNLNDKFQQEKATLNDKHATGSETKTILEAHSEGKVESILQKIPLNQQFQITNDVFGGMKSVYNSFIEKVDQAHSFADATLLVDEFVSKTEHKESNKFLHGLVERKFML